MPIRPSLFSSSMVTAIPLAKQDGTILVSPLPLFKDVAATAKVDDDAVELVTTTTLPALLDTETISGVAAAAGTLPMVPALLSFAFTNFFFEGDSGFDVRVAFVETETGFIGVGLSGTTALLNVELISRNQKKMLDQ